LHSITIKFFDIKKVFIICKIKEKFFLYISISICDLSIYLANKNFMY